MSDLSRHKLKSYELRERIGAGKLGVVYRAFQPAIERDVAIKVIRPEYANRPEFARRFESEVQIIARLEHPHIAPLLDYWRDAEGAYLVMRWLPTSLHAALGDGAWSLKATARLLEQIAGALTVAHQAGIVHRNIKPSNLLLDEDKNAYLADFRIAQDISDGSRQQAETDSLSVYLAPEQIKSEEITPRTDIYSLGLVVYEMLVNERAYSAATTPQELIYHHLNTPLFRSGARRVNLSATIEEALQTATMKLPEQRYASIAQFAAAFQAGIPNLQQAASRPLTERELDILRLMIQDLSKGEIAERLVLSPTTIKWYIRQIYVKLDVHSRRQAMERADQLQLFGVQPASVSPSAIESTTVEARQSAARPLIAPELFNPYKGLRAFQEADVTTFFGRAALTEQLLSRLMSSGDGARFLTIVGASGSGKTSVVKAGLIPALRKGALPNSARWFITDFLPGAHPLEELEDALIRVSVNPLPGVLAPLFQDRRGLVRAINRMLPSDSDVELVLVIDQFEELFTLVSDEEIRTRFIDLLVAAATDPRGRVRIILTLRADFYDRPLLYPRLAELVSKHTQAVIPLTASELEEVIVEPAERVGLRFETGLVVTILKDIGQQPGALPLLEYALSELYERRQDRLLTLAAYRALGGISGALAHRADDLYESLDETGRTAARQMFLRLITLGAGVEDTRRRVLQTELGSLMDKTGLMDDVIEVFGAYRLLTLDRDAATRAPTVEIAHEALFHEWGRLREWLRANREALHIQRRLLAASEEWRQSGYAAGFLATGARLTQFEALATEGEVALTQEEGDYLTVSVAAQTQADQAERQRQTHELQLAQQATAAQKRSANRLRSLVGFLALFLIVATGLSVNALNSRADAVAERQLANASAATSQGNFIRAEAQRLAAASNNVQLRQGDSETAALLALRSMNLQYTPQGDEALTNASFLDLPLKAFGGQHFSSSTLEFSPDGKTLLTANNDATTTLWDIATGRELHSFSGHTRPVTAANFSPDGMMIVTASLDQTLKLWDAATGQFIRSFYGHTDAVVAAAFSPDGKTIASASSDHTARLWDVQTGKEVRQFVGHMDALVGVTFSPDGRTLITAGHDHTVRLWDVQTGQQLRQITVGAMITSIGVSHDGRMLVTGSDDAIIRLWDIQSGQVIRQLTGHTWWISSTVFSRDDQTILSSSYDQTARLWDVQTGQELRRFVGYSTGLTEATFAPDGQSVATIGLGVIKLWSLKRNPNVLQLDTHSGYLNNVLFSPDGKSLLTAEESGTAHLWDVQTDQPIRTFANLGQPTWALAISPDGKRILTSQNTNTTTTITLWDAQTGQALHDLTSDGGDSGNQNVTFSPDGHYALIGDGAGIIHLMDLQSWQEVRRTTGNPGWGEASIAAVAYARDGKTILTGANDFAARLWNVASGLQIYQLDILVYVPGTNDTVHSPDTGAYSTAYSPDGKLLAAGTWGGSIYIWDFATGQQIERLVGHSGAVMVTFSADGKYLMSSGADGTVRLWDVHTWQEGRRLLTTSFGLAAITPDSHSILDVTGLNTAQLVPADYHAITQDLCSRLTRDLSDDERRAYDIGDNSPTCPPGRPLPSSQTPLWTMPVPPVWTPVSSPLRPYPNATPFSR